MREKNSTVLSYNSNSELQKIIAQKLYAEIEKRLKFQERSACEIGCGTGFLTNELLNGVVKKLTCVDKSKIFCNFIEQNYQEKIADLSLEVICDDFTGFDRINKFDLYLSSMSLQWIGDWICGDFFPNIVDKKYAFAIPIFGSLNAIFDKMKLYGIHSNILEFCHQDKYVDSLKCADFFVDNFSEKVEFSTALKRLQVYKYGNQVVKSNNFIAIKKALQDNEMIEFTYKVLFLFRL
jgi:predicted TPR repeat methyltransferase